MNSTRFFKFPQTVLLALLALCSLTSHAGTITLDVTTANAGTTGVGTTSFTKLFYTITNTGTTNLSVTNVTSSSADFIVQQPLAAQLPVTVLPSATYIVAVAFKPSATGARTGNITILSNDPVKPSTVVTATGTGGIEQSIRLTPLTPFEVELGQGVVLRANVTFTNGATGITLLNWSSSNTAVATAAVGEIAFSFGTPVPTGNVATAALGTTTVTVSAAQTPSVTASVPITVVAATPHEFMGTARNDHVVRVKDSVWSLCYNFPEIDINNNPLYVTSQIGVTTPSLNTIGDVYVTAQNTGNSSDEVFFIKNCSLRTTVFNQPLLLASFQDLVVESTGNAVASNGTGSTLWQLTPTTSSLIANTGLPTDLITGLVDDVGALAIDSADNLYTANLIRTSTQQEAAVYVRPFGSPSWFPIAAVFGTVTPSSQGIPGMAAIYEGNKGYAMKTVAFDKTVVERYVDVNGDRSFYKIVGTAIVPDPGEIVEVAVIDAGIGINVDAKRNLILSVAEPLGRSIVKMTDKNNNGNFKDPGEYKVIYASTIFTRLQDIAFAAPCLDRPPTARIGTLPLTGTVDIGGTLLLLGGGSSDPCSDPLSYAWTDEDAVPPTALCTTLSCSFACTGLPALHTVGLTVTDAAGNSNKTTKVLKCGPPILNGFWPGNGITNTGVFLFGKNFKVASGANPTVCFNNGTLCQSIVQIIAPDLLFTVQPANTLVGKITVETAMGKTSTSTDYNQPPLPGLKINGVWPGEVKVGGIVFIFGAGFGITPGANVINVNGTSAPLVQSVDSSLLLFFVPVGLTPGPGVINLTVSAQTLSAPIVILP